MFQLDNTFLEEVGLGTLPEDQKQVFLEYFREQLEVRVGTRLSEGLTDAQLDEFESFMNRDEPKINEWIRTNAVDYKDDQIYQQLRSGAPADIPEIVVLAEYASLKWLSINRSDYRQVVASVMDDLKKETMNNRDAIIASVENPQA